LPVGQAMSLSFGHDLKVVGAARKSSDAKRGSNAALPWAFMRVRFAYAALKAFPLGRRTSVCREF
jgi:hypothetical protein